MVLLWAGNQRHFAHQLERSSQLNPHRRLITLIIIILDASDREKIHIRKLTLVVISTRYCFHLFLRIEQGNKIFSSQIFCIQNINNERSIEKHRAIVTDGNVMDGMFFYNLRSSTIKQASVFSQFWNHIIDIRHH